MCNDPGRAFIDGVLEGSLGKISAGGVGRLEFNGIIYQT